MSKSVSYCGKPKVAEVKITKIPVNPKDLGDGCKKIPVAIPATPSPQPLKSQ